MADRARHAGKLLAGNRMAPAPLFTCDDRLTVREVGLRIPRWPLGGLRVAALSDFHAGDAARLRQIVDRCNAQHPDLIVLLGDYVTPAMGTGLTPEAIAAELGSLRAPLGVWAVLGNHDWWLDGERVWKALERHGIHVLEKSAARAGDLWIAGAADDMTRDSDPRIPLRAVPPDAPVLLITHNPDVFPEVPSRVQLTLAGHTHGGQVRLPWLGPPIVPSRFGQRYARGHIVEGGRHLFVTTGLGTSIIPIRLGVPPEIVILTLSN